MVRDRTPWHESDNPLTVVRGGTWRGMIWVLAVVVFFALISGAFFVGRTLLAEPAGRAGAYQQKESANNRIFAQQQFEELAAEITATQAKIAAAGKVRETSPEAEIRYQGLISYCASTAAQYNAASRSYTTEQFKAADLPASYDPATDCEPTS